jgi:hypothetical protein
MGVSGFNSREANPVMQKIGARKCLQSYDPSLPLMGKQEPVQWSALPVGSQGLFPLCRDRTDCGKQSVGQEVQHVTCFHFS